MPRDSKIRKRGCSSSSSSSILHKYPLKKAILVRKRGGSTTPVPSWKINAGSPLSAAGISDTSQYQASHVGGKGLQAPVSARKLASALWEMNKISPSQAVDDQPDRILRKEMRGRSRIVTNPSHSPELEGMSQSSSNNLSRTMPTVPQKFRCNKHNHRAVDLAGCTSFMETDACSQGSTPTSSFLGTKSCLKDLNDGLLTSKELLKLLSHIWGLKEKHASAISLFSALHTEMNRACVQVDHLVQEQKSIQSTINYLKERFAEERIAWKRKEEERIRAAVCFLMDELDTEKRFRRRMERLNEKLGIELARTREFLLKSVRELKNERGSREIIEQVCNELVRGIGEDKAEVEELKRESAKVQKELEKEREMLQIADEWREERVQMKISEAKFQFEEKNAAVDQLRNELEAYLTTKRTEDPISIHEDVVGGSELNKNSHVVQPSNSLIVNEREETVGLKDEDEEDDEVGSVDSDLHSIELNMDGNDKSYRWSYARVASKDDANFNLVVERKSVARNSFSSDGDTSMSKNFQHLGDEQDRGVLSESSNLLENQELKQEEERYISVKGLRERMLAASRIALPRGLASH